MWPKTAVQSCDQKLPWRAVTRNCRGELWPETAVESCDQKLPWRAVTRNCRGELWPETAVQSCDQNCCAELWPKTAVESCDQKLLWRAVHSCDQSRWKGNQETLLNNYYSFRQLGINSTHISRNAHGFVPAWTLNGYQLNSRQLAAFFGCQFASDVWRLPTPRCGDLLWSLSWCHNPSPCLFRKSCGWNDHALSWCMGGWVDG